MIELTVILKDAEQTYKHRSTDYELISHDNPIIQKYVEDAKKNFPGEPEDITIKISMEIQ